jgi:hypothetical protein
MTRERAHLGDSHNFGRRVSMGATRVHKPRALLWEWLLLSKESPLRRRLDEAAAASELGPGAFSFLPDLSFTFAADGIGGEVDRVVLAPLPTLDDAARRDLARIVGRSIALYAWLGVSDLHWENLVLGAADDGRVVFAPLDVEMILAELSLPTETKLLPDADPEYAAICRHACGVRRALPYLGKPVAAGDLVAMAGAYLGALELLDRHAGAIAEAFTSLPALRETPIRVCLRGTEEYVHPPADLWPPFLDAESEQLARGDIPYFFRLYGERGIHYYAEPTLTRRATLPLEGDVPQLDPMLRLSRGLRAPSRKKLREEGLFTLIGAFDHKSIAGRHREGALAIQFGARSLVLTLPGGEELHSRRDLRAFVGSVYLPCSCGEVRAVFVPPVTVCDAS